MYLGIVYTNSSKFEVLQFFKKDKIENFDKNNVSVPSIILGKKNCIDLFGEVSVLNRQITDNVLWTYNKMEKRSEFEVDIENFYKNVFKKLIKNIKYININVYNIGYNEIKHYYNIFNNENNKKVVYVTNNMLYIYCGSNVYGISTEEVKYVNIDASKVINKLINLPNCEIITSNNFIKNDVKKMIINQNYLTPYLYLLG